MYLLVCHVCVFACVLYVHVCVNIDIILRTPWGYIRICEYNVVRMYDVYACACMFICVNVYIYVYSCDVCVY